jgi:hypothetical protein
MSTTTQASRSDAQRATRAHKGILAVSAIIAVGVAILFLLSLGGTHRIATPAATSGHPASPAAAPAVIAAPPPAGYYRDPTTHALLRVGQVGQAGCNAALLRVEKACPRP